MKQPPPSCLGVLGALVYYQGGWVGTSTILGSNVGTTCIHKRLSELIGLGLVEKKEDPYKKRRMLYRVVPGVKIVCSEVTR